MLSFLFFALNCSDQTHIEAITRGGARPSGSGAGGRGSSAPFPWKTSKDYPCLPLDQVIQQFDVHNAGGRAAVYVSDLDLRQGSDNPVDEPSQPVAEASLALYLLPPTKAAGDVALAHAWVPANRLASSPLLEDLVRVQSMEDKCQSVSFFKDKDKVVEKFKIVQGSQTHLELKSLQTPGSWRVYDWDGQQLLISEYRLQDLKVCDTAGNFTNANLTLMRRLTVVPPQAASASSQSSNPTLIYTVSLRLAKLLVKDLFDPPSLLLDAVNAQHSPQQPGQARPYTKNTGGPTPKGFWPQGLRGTGTNPSNPAPVTPATTRKDSSPAVQDGITIPNYVYLQLMSLGDEAGNRPVRIQNCNSSF